MASAATNLLPFYMLLIFTISAVACPDGDVEVQEQQPQRRELLQNGLGQTPPMGWNSWNHFRCKITEKIVRETADALVSTGLAALGYNYVNIDDCWAELTRDDKGNLRARNRTFPSGIKSLADYVHSKGLKLGIYSDAGYYTCKRQPGSLGHEDQDAKSFASWGVDYLKYDNCFDDGTKPEIRYPKMRDALNATGRAIFFSMCEWGKDNPALWASKVGNSWRTTGDIKDSWNSMISRADENNKWANYAGPGGWNDPDMLEVGNGNMTLEEYRTHISLWALMKAPLIIGCDVRNMSSDYLQLLNNEDVIQINQDPIGVQGKKVGLKGEIEIWTGELSNNRHGVVLLNRGAAEANATVTLSDVGLTSLNSTVTVHDIWQKSSLSNQKEITSKISSHACKLFILYK